MDVLAPYGRYMSICGLKKGHETEFKLHCNLQHQYHHCGNRSYMSQGSCRCQVTQFTPSADKEALPMPCESLCLLHLEHILLESLHRESRWKQKKPDMQNRGSGTVIHWTFALSLSPFMSSRKIMCLNHGLNCGSFPSPSIQRLKMSLHDLHVCLGFCRKQNVNNSAGHVFCVSSWLFLIKTSATWAKVRRWDSRCPKTNSVEVPGSLGSLSNLVVSMCPSEVAFSVGISIISWSNAKEKGKLDNVWKKNMEPLSCSCFSVSLWFWVPRPLCRKQCLASAPPTRMLCNWCHPQFHSAQSQPEVDHLSDLNPFCNVRWNHRCDNTNCRASTRWLRKWWPWQSQVLHSSNYKKTTWNSTNTKMILKKSLSYFFYHTNCNLLSHVFFFEEKMVSFILLGGLLRQAMLGSFCSWRDRCRFCTGKVEARNVWRGWISCKGYPEFARTSMKSKRAYKSIWATIVRSVGQCLLFLLTSSECLDLQLLLQQHCDDEAFPLWFHAVPGEWSKWALVSAVFDSIRVCPWQNVMCQNFLGIKSASCVHISKWFEI